MKIKFGFVHLALLFVVGASAYESRDLIRITNGNHNQVREIEATGAWVNYIDRDGVVAEATPEQQQFLKSIGYSTQVITADITGIYDRNFNASDGRYLTYTEFCDTMTVIAQNNPSICKLETLGFSYNNNLLLAMKVSDNPEVHENEPAVHFEGAIHGDEKISWAITFELLKYLVSRYGSDTFVTRLVDTREIYLLPMFNPDGYIASRRYNGNSVDLNRNWGWMWGNELNQGARPFSEPENRAVLAHIWRHPFVTFVSYHAGKTFISYPWSYCYSYQNTIPELNLIQFLSARYAYWTHYTYGQGSDTMYLINGSTKDFDYGYGMMGWSIETHLVKTPPASEIDSTFNLNRPAMLELIDNAGKGIHGTVTDAITGEPVHCQIWVKPANWLSYNNQELGDFHRFYLPGTFTLTFRAPGYRDTIIENLVVPDTGDSSVTIEVQLVPDSAAPVFAFRHIYNSFVSASSNRTYPIRALGPHNDTAFILDKGKYICLDMGKMVYDNEGTDIVVYRSGGTGTAQVHVADNWLGPWTVIGVANEAASQFDIGSVGVDSLRYIKLTSAGQFYLNAVEGINNVGITQAPPSSLPKPLQLILRPTHAQGSVSFSLNFLTESFIQLTISERS
ncbi:MAG: M14 family zinc carboxypeptidase [bacterium]